MEISFSSTTTQSGHTEYSIVVIKAGHKTHVTKRYSEMLSLHKKLISVGTPLPAFPPKKAFGNLKPEFVLRRQVDLQNYFRQVIKLREVRKSLAFKQFVGFRQPTVNPNFAKVTLDEETAMGAALSGYS